MSIKVLSMAFSKSKIEDKVAEQIEALCTELLKVFVHAPSTTDEAWEREIQGKYIRSIRRYSHSVKKERKLKPKILKALLEDHLVGGVYAFIPAVWYDRDYKAKKKSGTLDECEACIDDLKYALGRLVPTLVISWLAASENNEADRNIAAKLVNEVKRVRATIGAK